MNAIYLMLGIGIPVVVVFGGALLAFSFSSGDSEYEQAEASRQAAAEIPAQESRPLVFFQPMGWSANATRRSVDDIVADIETHLHKERQAASAFARNPSHNTLMVD